MIARALILVLVGIAAVLVYSTCFVVGEGTQAVITQFGAPVKVVTEPGLHTRTPFVQQVNRFEHRILEWDGEAREIPTREKQLVYIDTYARWRIDDALLFYKSVRNEPGAHGRLDDIIDASTRDVVSRNRLIEMVRDTARPLSVEGAEGAETGAMAPEVPQLGRSQIERQILDAARPAVKRLGIELLDVRIKRVKYVEDVQKKIFERMNSERLQKAEMFRSEGKGKAAEISGERDRELLSIKSEAYKKEQEIKGKADAEATRIYAEAYGQDPRFYAFVKTLDTYRETLGANSVVVLSAEAEYWRLLKELPKAQGAP
ncbi:MAG: protease modulator HflC [Acidobacteriota bacterium]